jgi:GNAT superfamily N-acetyltransferase
VWVEPQSRGKGIGRALVSQALKSSAEAGRIVQCVWTQRPGQLRYFFNKSGFEDTLSAQYYAP